MSIYYTHKRHLVNCLFQIGLGKAVSWRFGLENIGHKDRFEKAINECDFKRLGGCGGERDEYLGGLSGSLLSIRVK